MNFLDNIKRVVSGPKEEPDETSRAILDIENKKRTISQASFNEQNTIKERINDEYKKIGEIAYTSYSEDCFEISKITDNLATIKNLFQSLNEKQEKLSEILNRYDEELQILRPVSTASGTQSQCKNCGNPYTIGVDIFCRGCGNKLPDTNSFIDSNASVTNSHHLCHNCNKENDSGSMFCKGCGAKLQ